MSSARCGNHARIQKTSTGLAGPNSRFRQWTGVRRDGDPPLAHGRPDRNRHLDPGKPWQNATDESFNGKFRDEHLSLQWFRNRVEAKVGMSSGDATTTTCGHTRVWGISRRRNSKRMQRRNEESQAVTQGAIFQ